MAEEVLTRKKLNKLCNERLVFRTCKTCPRRLSGERSCIKPVTYKSSKSEKKKAISLFNEINIFVDCMDFYSLKR